MLQTPTFSSVRSTLPASTSFQVQHGAHGYDDVHGTGAQVDQDDMLHPDYLIASHEKFRSASPHSAEAAALKLELQVINITVPKYVFIDLCRPAALAATIHESGAAGAASHSTANSSHVP
jgi:hypothetical protein